MPEMTSIENLSQPAMVIDIARPEIREANAAAMRLWGLRGSVDLPIPLDPAMPALKHLAQRHHNNIDQQQTTALVFWTWAGAQSLRCSFRPLTDADAALVVFEDGLSCIEPEPEAPTRRPAGDHSNDQPALTTNDSFDIQTMMPSMAHELRTPIGAIIALAEMIETEQFGPVGDPRYREYARDIGDSARLSLGIVASSLEQNAPGTDLLSSFADLDLAELIQKCLRTVHQSAHEAKVTLRQVLPSDLPHLIANGPGLTQILLNLLTNAIKFTPEGGTITIEVIVTAEAGIRVSVRDTGVGMTVIDASVLIADDDQSRPLDTTTSHGGGGLPPRRGIGFSLVRRLADAMSAKFEITSARGVGTHVSLTFPSGKVIPMVTAQSVTQKAD